MTEMVLDDGALGALLAVLASRQGSVPKYRYPSAGTLYPVQTYIVLRRPTGAVDAGSYYYDPEAHELVALSAETPAAPDGSMPAVLVILVAQRAAIAPIYGDEADAFCLLEAGYMTEALRADAAALVLRDAGGGAGSTDLIRACRLEESHLPLICLAVEEAKT